MNSEISKTVAIHHSLVTKSLNILMGILNGIVCDDQLHDSEIRFLSLWMEGNKHIGDKYPANIVFRRVKEVLRDNVITEDERTNLLKDLKIVCGNDFSHTGAALPEHISSVFDDDPYVIISERSFVLTGEFLFGTRAICEKAISARGGIVKSAVSSRTNYLVVGTMSSPHWLTANFGTKIQKAAEMSSSGDYEISIVRENDWAMAL